MIKVPSAESNYSALMTDLYQLTMAQGYWKKGIHNTQAVFNLFFRKLPFNGNFAIAAGLEYVLDLIPNFSFFKDDIEYLSSLKHINSEKPVFDKEFLKYLSELKFTVDIDAVPEGTVIFENEPIIRVTGSLLQCQLLETILLNIVNPQTLIATKAARIAIAAKGDTVLEFGLRRCQGFGGLEASRSSFIGGCDATSNVLAAKMFKIPVMGTHAHSWIMSFDSELEAFDAWCEIDPENSILLVDTYNVKKGIENAILAGKKLQAKGQNLKGIRLDSGNLYELSIMARKMLDDAGFHTTLIVASGDLDEYEISLLKMRKAKIDTWGVGTNLVTAADQPALGSVFKLGAVRPDNKSDWKHKIKFSENTSKTTNPGILNVLRVVSEEGFYWKDIIFDEITQPSAFFNTKNRFGLTEKYISTIILLKPYMEKGKLLSHIDLPTTYSIQKFVNSELSLINPDLLSLYKGSNLVSYSVELEKELNDKKISMFNENRFKQ